MRPIIVETVYNLDEFLKLIAPESRIHYGYYYKPTRVSGLIEKIEAGIVLFGLTREGFVIKCLLTEKISWDSPELNKYKGTNLYDRYEAWMKEIYRKYEQKAKEIGATLGRFEMKVIA